MAEGAQVKGPSTGNACGARDDRKTLQSQVPPTGSAGAPGKVAQRRWETSEGKISDYRGLASHELTAATGSGRRGGTRDAVYMLRIAWRKPNASIGGQYTWQKKKGEEIEGYI